MNSPINLDPPSKLKLGVYNIFFILTIPVTLVVTYIYGLWWWLLAGMVYSKILGIFGVQIGLHRYFAHRTFTTGKLRHILLCYVSLLTGESSPIIWARVHVHHHKYSDTDRDFHSPNAESFFHATVGWVFKNNEWRASRKLDHLPISLYKDKHVNFVHTHWFTIWASLIVLTLLVSWKICLFLLLFPAAFATINSSVMTNGLAHLTLPGSYRNFETSDKSTNNKWIQVYQIGEGLHNNHHKYPNRYSQAVEPHERDPVAWIVEKFFIETDPNSKYKL